MKKSRSALTILCLLVLASSVVAQAPDLTRMDLVLKSIPDGPIAKVNGVNIEASTFVRLYSMELARLQAYAGKQTIEDADRIIIAMSSLRVLIEQEILLTEGQRRKLKVSDAEADKAWDDLCKELAGGKETPLSRAEVATMTGVSVEEVTKRLKRSALIDRVREAIVGEAKITISKKELRGAYDENKAMFKRPDLCHLKQIYISGAEGSDKRGEAKKKCEDALLRIKTGQSFEAVAKAVSEGPQREKGGDLGSVPMEELRRSVPFYADVVHKMKPEQVSGIIESPVGFHLIKMVEFTPGSNAEFDKVKGMLESELRRDKEGKAVNAYCLKAGESMDLRTYLELDKTIDTHPKREELLKALGKDGGE